jgi:hypothetical protein
MKTKAIILTLTLAFFAFGNQVFSQKIDLTNVTSIDVNIACQLIIVQGNSPNLEIVGEESAIKDVETKIRNGNLIITSDRNNQRKKDVVVKIEIADLKELNIGGAVDMKTVKTLELADFVLSISGVGNIEMDLKSNDFKLKCSGVGNVDISGNCNTMRMSVSGVGNINATNFVAKNAYVTNSGVGKVNVHATEMLDAAVSGVGSVKYVGSPVISANVSGLGRISQY